MVEDERTKAAGRARVARDSLAFEDIHMKEAEQKALADQALADFAAREGMVLEPASGQAGPAATPPTKTMGPQSQ
jgi:phage shock protein A